MVSCDRNEENAQIKNRGL